jgi:hypothetical protein
MTFDGQTNGVLVSLAVVASEASGAGTPPPSAGASAEAPNDPHATTKAAQRTDAKASRAMIPAYFTAPGYVAVMDTL